MTKQQQQSTKSQTERDAEELARMLAGPPDTWVEMGLWTSTHNVSAAYVAARYRAAAKPDVTECPPPPPPPPVSDPLSGYGRGEAELIRYLNDVRPSEGVSKTFLARRFDVSRLRIREICRDIDLHIPETLPRRGKDT